MPELKYARYGKDNIRLCKVHRDKATGEHVVVEMTVGIMLEGDIATSYTEGDNSVVVATDSQKQTCYILAKQHPVDPPELFAAIVGNHFVNRYNHIHTAHVKVKVHRWTRLTVEGKPHPHSFLRDGSEVRTAVALVRDHRSTNDAPGTELSSGISDLLVLKSTGSAFHGFIRDEYTRLPETWDRILSTEVQCTWHWNHFDNLDAVKAEVAKFTPAWENARKITLETFAKDSSASVQNTMYKMSEQILEVAPGVSKVDYTLPNKHYFDIDLSWFQGLKNTGHDAEVYAPQTDPNGLIECSVSRNGK